MPSFLFRQLFVVIAFVITGTITWSPASAEIVFIDDDFSGPTLTNGGIVRDAVGWKKASNKKWELSNGQLVNNGGSTNSNDTTRQRDNEAAVGQVIRVADFNVGTANQLTLSFDYTTNDAGESLYIHIWGYVENGTPSSSGTGLMNNGASNGNAWESSGAVFDQYNLTDETLGLGPASTAIRLTGATGAQQYANTFDLSGFFTAPNNLGGYDYLVLGFARDEPGDGDSSGVTIDNLRFFASVPEPTSSCLFGASAICLLLRRRR